MRCVLEGDELLPSSLLSLKLIAPLVEGVLSRSAVPNTSPARLFSSVLQTY